MFFDTRIAKEKLWYKLDNLTNLDYAKENYTFPSSYINKRVSDERLFGTEMYDIEKWTVIR